MISEREQLVEDIISLKVENTLLKRKRRLIIEELYRQFVEGEVEPKRRIAKTMELSQEGQEKTKRSRSSKQSSSTTSITGDAKDTTININ